VRFRPWQQQGVIGPLQAWILWYFLCSMGFTRSMRKALNVRPRRPDPEGLDGLRLSFFYSRASFLDLRCSRF